MKFIKVATVILLQLLLVMKLCGQQPAMYYADSSRTGKPMAKDPNVIFFKGEYFMYYSIPPSGADKPGWGIGIATSKDLINWQKNGEMAPGATYEKNGLCAPAALVKDGKLHLFYQTYGNGKKDAICHATSDNGLDFIRDATNPIFSPTGDWNCGRAIDAEVIEFNGKYFLYFASRDTGYQFQFQGVATTGLRSTFHRDEWTQVAMDSAILFPQLAWEKKCVEGASCIAIDGWLYMFYAGGYNNEPQQIGIAKSKDGIKWVRLSDTPFLANGKAGSWNESESGHPDIVKDELGKYHLFYQGNNDKGKTWYLSKRDLIFLNGRWILK